jgi:hypothetical protein
MQDLCKDISCVSYLVELRKLLAKQREHQREDDRVGHRRSQAGLARGEDAVGTRRKGQQHTRAEKDEQGRRDQEVGLGEDQVHRPSREGEREQEHQGVEEDGHLAGLSVGELDVSAGGGQENARAERKKKGRRESNFRRRDVGEHLLYDEIIYLGECSLTHAAKS